MIYPHYSGNKHCVVQGIDIVNLVHSSGQKDYYPVDYRIYAPEYQQVKKTKNDYFLEMLQDAFAKKKIQARYILFDSWYASFQNLNYIHQSERLFYITLHKDRLISLSKDQGYIHLQYIPWDDVSLTAGIKVKLKRTPYIFTLFKIVAENANIDWVITNDPDPNITSDHVKKHFYTRWDIECFHRELKQLTGIEKCQCHSQQAQRHHIMYCYLAWISLAKHARSIGKTIYSLKTSLISDYMRNILQKPFVPVLTIV